MAPPYCKETHPFIVLLWNTLLVAVVFMLIDYLYYGLISPQQDPYSKDLLNKIIFTVLFSLFFAHLYNKTSRLWRPNNKGDAFLFKQKAVADANLCEISIPKLLNGVVFSLLVSAIILMAMWLATFVLSSLFLYVLQGIRGLPLNTGSDAVLVTEVVIAGITLECIGKTESDPIRQD